MNTSMAIFNSSSSIKVGASLIILLFGSLLLGNVAPAGVSDTPNTEQSSITSDAIGLDVLYVMK